MTGVGVPRGKDLEPDAEVSPRKGLEPETGVPPERIMAVVPPTVRLTNKLKILPSLALRTREVNVPLFAIAFVSIHKFAKCTFNRKDHLFL